MARLFDTAHAVPLNALTIRLAFLLDRDSIALAQNLFRPNIWLEAIHLSWCEVIQLSGCEFNPDTAAHCLILPLLKPDVFIALRPIFDALNDTLIAGGVLPDLSNAYRVRKSDGNLSAATTGARGVAIRQKLRALFASDAELASNHGNITGEVGSADQDVGQMPRMDGLASHRLVNYLSQLQNRIPAASASNLRLSEVKVKVKVHLPDRTLTPVDETTIDLTAHVFDSVFAHQHIPHEIKNLIGLLQMPMLKTALADKDFFYGEAHPARTLIDLLTRASMGWDPLKGQDDPLYQTMKRTVERAQAEQFADADGASFRQAVTDLEAYLHEDDATSTTALEAPITRALHAEKIRFAAISDQKDIDERTGTGEVAPFVEAFLEQR